MCTCPQSINIRSSRAQGALYSSVPCGKCEECRKSVKSSWSFRLGVELESKKKSGWLIGFLTLTYSDEHLPYVPKECLKKYHKKDRIQCFNRLHVRNFIDNIRKRLWDINKDYKENDKLVYFAASEYGSTTKRSHYHVMLSWNPALGCSGEKMFELVNKYWNYGFIFPRYFNGGQDEKGYFHKPFLVTASAYDAARYCGKYVCKDLTFESNLKNVCVKMDSFRNCKYFHMQSKSLGLSVLKNLNDEDKKRLLIDGYCFNGDSSFVSIPLYIKKKILFDNYYIYVDEHLREREKIKGVKLPENWKRLCRFRANEFFKQNAELVYKVQCKVYEKVFADFRESSFCLRYGFYDYFKDDRYIATVENCRKEIVRSISEYETKYSRNFVRDFVAFGLVDFRFAYDVDGSMLYLNRYIDGLDESLPLVKRCIYDDLHDIISRYLNFILHGKRFRFTENDIILMVTDDFHNNQWDFANAV